MEPTALVQLVAILQLQVHRDLVVLQIEVAGDDFLDSVPLSFNFTTKFSNHVALRLIIGRRRPSGYGAHIDIGSAGCCDVVVASGTGKFLDAFPPVLFYWASTARAQSVIGNNGRSCERWGQIPLSWSRM